MGWNGSGNDGGDRAVINRVGVENASLHDKKKRHRKFVLIIAGIAIASLAVFFFGTSTRNNATHIQGVECSSHSSYIRNIGTNAIQLSSTESGGAETTEKPYNDMSRNEKLKYWRDKYGDNLPDNIKPIVYYLENEPKVNYRGKSSITSIFAHRSERDIASFLMVQPGKWIMRPLSFGDNFDKDLAQSMAEPIEIFQNDSEEVRALKQAVIDTKAYMLEEAKKGKSPSTILTEAAQELYTLGQYKRDLESEIRVIKNDPTVSDDDLAIAIEAANKMLEKKGLNPLRQPNMLIRHSLLKRKL